MPALLTSQSSLKLKTPLLKGLLPSFIRSLCFSALGGLSDGSAALSSFFAPANRLSSNGLATFYLFDSASAGSYNSEPGLAESESSESSYEYPA